MLANTGFCRSILCKTFLNYDPASTLLTLSVHNPSPVLALPVGNTTPSKKENTVSKELQTEVLPQIQRVMRSTVTGEF